MILVDTSVLINFFKGIENEKVNKLTEIINNGIPFGINKHIYMEIMHWFILNAEEKVLQ